MVGRSGDRSGFDTLEEAELHLRNQMEQAARQAAPLDLLALYVATDEIDPGTGDTYGQGPGRTGRQTCYGMVVCPADTSDGYLTGRFVRAVQAQLVRQGWTAHTETHGDVVHVTAARGGFQIRVVCDPADPASQWNGWTPVFTA